MIYATSRYDADDCNGILTLDLTNSQRVGQTTRAVIGCEDQMFLKETSIFTEALSHL